MQVLSWCELGGCGRRGGVGWVAKPRRGRRAGVGSANSQCRAPAPQPTTPLARSSVHSATRPHPTLPPTPPPSCLQRAKHRQRVTLVQARRPAVSGHILGQGCALGHQGRGRGWGGRHGAAAAAGRAGRGCLVRAGPEARFAAWQTVAGPGAHSSDGDVGGLGGPRHRHWAVGGAVCVATRTARLATGLGRPAGRLHPRAAPLLPLPKPLHPPPPPLLACL